MGLYLSTPVTEKHTHYEECNEFKFASSEMQGWRCDMEDACITHVNFAPDCSLFAVFDGHGGKEVALFCKKHFVEELLKNQNFKDRKNIEQALTQTFIRMDEMLQTTQGKKELRQLKNDEDMEESCAGCTANVALFIKGELYVANAGDSRSILMSNDEVEEMSIDHKPDDPIERNRVEKAGGFITDGRIQGNLNLSRAIGDLEYKKDTKLKPHEQIISCVPDIKRRTITQNDQFLLMGCDGIYEVHSNEDLGKFVLGRMQNRIKADQILEQLLDFNLAKDTMSGLGCDNMTTILIQFQR